MSEKLYLDDLYVGQKFVSDGYPLDEAQIIAYARQFDPRSFTSTPKLPSTPSSRAWPPAAGIRPPSACCW